MGNLINCRSICTFFKNAKHTAHYEEEEQTYTFYASEDTGCFDNIVFNEHFSYTDDVKESEIP